MKDYRVSLKDYYDYLKTLQKSIFKILPLYEEDNDYLNEYVNRTLDKVIHVKEIIEPLPYGDWYVDVLCNLKILEELSKSDNNHKKIKQVTFDSTKLLEVQIKIISKRM